jgi:ATP-dependent Lon protease
MTEQDDFPMSAAPMKEGSGDTLPLLPLRRGVLFPGTMLTVSVGRQRSAEVFTKFRPGATVAVGTQREAQVEDPVRADLHDYATRARVHAVRKIDSETYRVMLAGLERIELGEITVSDPYLVVEAHELEETDADSPDAEALAESLREHVTELVAGSGGNLAQAAASASSPGGLADGVAAGLDIELDEELEVLMSLDVPERLRLVARLVNEAHAKHEMKKKIHEEVRQSINKTQREHLLREQLKAINKELGNESDDDKKESLEKKLAERDLPEEVREVVDRELQRLSTLQAGHPEHNVARNYLEWIAELPWDQRAEVNDDLDAMAEKLDADHNGLGEVKKRILEHVAVLKLSGNPRGTILGFAGPPGVGKTSLGQSIADSTGRPFIRIALGGVRDEAEIRGHRRTYVGAIPGRIMSALRKAKVKNPVILLDEIDKLGRGWAGDPEAALLELLDPEQNRTFTDHYMELPFDLSEVMFICTANDLGNLSAPLRDRLEIIEIQGYTPDEKLAIARDHLIPDQLEEHAIGADALDLGDEALIKIIKAYTREAGVRQLKREIGKLCRRVALAVARASDGKAPRVNVTIDDLDEYLGKPKFHSEVRERTAVPGVATGLAWTPVGGDILFIETSRMKGHGKLQITGQLGDVMKESAQAALTYVRSNAGKLGVDPAFLEEQDVHIHVPAGAVPKDGPSAGVTIFSALTSLLTGRRIRPDTAMTGECTLRGRVMPVGGIKAKVLAAHRAGLTRVILPSRNARDLDEVPESVRAQMEFILAEDMSQVLENALEDEGSPDGAGASHSGEARQDPPVHAA